LDPHFDSHLDPAKVQPNLNEADLPSRFWLLLVLTGIASGITSGLLMRLLRLVEHTSYPAHAGNYLNDVTDASGLRRFLALLLAGVLVAVTLAALRHFRARRPSTRDITGTTAHEPEPARTVTQALLSIVTVGMGAPLGREAALKQVGAVLGGLFGGGGRLTPAQRSLLIACGTGAGMGAAYNVPIGGALFAVEVVLGTITVQSVLAAALCSAIATAVSWLLLPNVPAYILPALHVDRSVLLFAILAGPLFGIASAGFVACITWGRAGRLRGWAAWLLPVVVFASIGVAATSFPQLAGNGKDVVQLAFLLSEPLRFVVFLALLRTAATVAALRVGAPGGLFTPTMSFGALLGAAFGRIWIHIVPSAQPTACILIGAGAVLAAATGGPISSLILVLEMTRRLDAMTAPMLLAIGGAMLTHKVLQNHTIYTHE
jgi:CIC family chloride channel protein